MERIKNLLARFVSNYLMPDYEAHKRAAKLYTSAETIMLRKDLAKIKERQERAEKHVRMFKDIFDRMVRLAVDLPEEEMTPFVHQAILEIEHGMNYLRK